MSSTTIDQAPVSRISSTMLRRSGTLHPLHVPAAPLSRSQQIRLQKSNPTPNPRGSWRRFVWPAAAGLAVGLGVTLFKLSPTRHSDPVSATTAAQPAAQVVNVARPSPATTASVALPATIRPWQVTTLHARVTGYLTAWNAELGTHVKAGDVLAEIETPELDQEVAEKESLAREAEAAAVQAAAERAEAEADLNVAVAQLAKTKAEVELSRSQLGRREKLLANRTVPQEEFDTFRNQWEIRTADVTSAEADVARRRTNLQTRAAIIEARQAAAKSRQANVERLKELQRFKHIVAPIDGVITRRTAEIGMLVTAGTEPLFVIQDMSRVRVQVNVPQANAVQTAAGVEALVSLPESSAQAVRGTITRIASSVDSTNRTMLAEIELDNAAHGFQPGSYAQVTLTTPQNGSAWTIPTNTLQMRVEGPHVAIVDRDNRVEIRRVTLGRNLGNRVVVVDGIRGGEQLVVNPGDSLNNGLSVQVTGEAIAQR